MLLDELDRPLYPELEAVEFVLKQERRAKPAAARVKPEDLIETEILDKLRKEGY